METEVKFTLTIREGGCQVIELDEDLPFEINGEKYTVPKGFCSDGMSVPQFLWSWLSAPVDARTLVPSVIHDWLYTVKVTTRRQADRWYWDELVKRGFGRAKALAVYHGVRLFGGSHWE